MTYRDDVPQPPACPVCTERDEVERSGTGSWLCCRDWTLFLGGQVEWEQMAGRRKQWANQQERVKEQHGS